MAHNGGGSTRFHRLPGTAVPIGTTTRNPSPLPLPTIATLSTASSSSMFPTTTTTNHFDRGDVITLAQPRPGIDRVRNEYIETPLRPTVIPHPLLQQQQHHHHHLHNHSSNNHHHHQLPILPIASKGNGKLDVSGRISPCLPHTNLAGVHRAVSGPSSIVGAHHHHHQQRISSPTSSSSSSSNNTHLSIPITTQPLTGSSSNRMLIGASFNKKDPLNNIKEGSQTAGMGLVVGGGGGGGEAATDAHEEQSIICHECKRCKCDACRKPRPLPATWICGNKYQCSAETFVETCSCMCCVKGLFYHCAKDCEMDDDVSCADRPCACGTHRRCSRFACIAILSTLMPCLLCYWPLRGCLRVCELCYTKYHSHGCRCVKRNVNASSTPTSTKGGGGGTAAARKALTQQDARQRNNKLEPVRSGKSKRLLDAQID